LVSGAFTPHSFSVFHLLFLNRFEATPSGATSVIFPKQGQCAGSAQSSQSPKQSVFGGLFVLQTVCAVDILRCSYHFSQVASVQTPNPAPVSRPTFYKDLGRRIKAERVKKGFTQESVAAAVGLSRTSLTNIEGGRQRLLMHTFAEIADALGTEMRELLPKKARAAEEMGLKLDSLPIELKNFVAQTMNQTQPYEQTTHSPKSSRNPKKNGHPKSPRER
jgi:transcriptional regulator with XRE-family HTH domain